MVDSADRERMFEAREELFGILESDEMRGVPVVVVANKQDLPGNCQRLFQEPFFLCVCVCVCACACACVRETERDRERDRQRQRERDRERERDSFWLQKFWDNILVSSYLLLPQID